LKTEVGTRIWPFDCFSLPPSKIGPAIFDYIEVFYNRLRIHQTLDFVSPVEFEQQLSSGGFNFKVRQVIWQRRNNPAQTPIPRERCWIGGLPRKTIRDRPPFFVSIAGVGSVCPRTSRNPTPKSIRTGKQNLAIQMPRRRRILALLACAFPALGAPTLEERKQKIREMEAAVAPEALQRRARSEQVLAAEQVPINKSLPAIETQSEARKRSKEEIAYRTLALLTVAIKAVEPEQQKVERMMKDYGLAPHFTPKERAFIDSRAPSQHDRSQFSWRFECAWVLLWALGYVDKLEKPVSPCNPASAFGFMRPRTPARFIAEAKLRNLSEILDQADRIYRYHWAVVDARVNGKPTPAGLDADVVMERHYALNWLIGYMKQEWDDISTDT
jgi:hypothetical protein